MAPIIGGEVFGKNLDAFKNAMIQQEEFQRWLLKNKLNAYSAGAIQGVQRLPRYASLLEAMEKLRGKVFGKNSVLGGELIGKKDMIATKVREANNIIKVRENEQNEELENENRCLVMMALGGVGAALLNAHKNAASIESDSHRLRYAEFQIKMNQQIDLTRRPRKCDLLVTSVIPLQNNLDQVVINSEMAYVRVHTKDQDKLFYVDKVGRICSEVEGLSKEQLADFDLKMKVAVPNELRTLSDAEIMDATAIVWHRHKKDISASLVADNFKKTFIYAYLDAYIESTNDDGLLKVMRRFLKETDRAFDVAKTPGLVFDQITIFDPKTKEADLDDVFLSQLGGMTDAVVEYIFNKVEEYLVKQQGSDADRNNFVNAITAITKMTQVATKKWNELAVSRHVDLEIPIKFKLPDLYNNLMKLEKTEQSRLHGVIHEFEVKCAQSASQISAAARLRVQTLMRDIRLAEEQSGGDTVKLRLDIQKIIIQNYMDFYVESREKAAGRGSNKDDVIELENVLVGFELALEERGQKGYLVDDAKAFAAKKTKREYDILGAAKMLGNINLEEVLQHLYDKIEHIYNQLNSAKKDETIKSAAKANAKQHLEQMKTALAQAERVKYNDKEEKKRAIDAAKAAVTSAEREVVDTREGKDKAIAARAELEDKAAQWIMNAWKVLERMDPFDAAPPADNKLFGAKKIWNERVCVGEEKALFRIPKEHFVRTEGDKELPRQRIGESAAKPLIVERLKHSVVQQLAARPSVTFGAASSSASAEHFKFFSPDDDMAAASSRGTKTQGMKEKEEVKQRAGLGSASSPHSKK